MRVASNLEDFLRAPLGACLIGRAFAYFYPIAGFNGFRLWGAPDGDDIQSLIAVLDVTRREGTLPYLSLIDLSLLEHVQPIVFQKMAAYQAERMPGYAAIIRRQAMVRPPGIVGALVAGFYHQLRPTFPVEIFDAVAAALAWLGWAGGPRWYAEFDALWKARAGSPPTIRELRHYLDGRLDADLDAAAGALLLTRRTLQRRLRDEGTSFQGEVNAARVRAAQHRMLETDEKLADIARSVGCTSLAHFSTLFRKATGETPSAWRARHR